MCPKGVGVSTIHSKGIHVAIVLVTSGFVALYVVLFVHTILYTNKIYVVNYNFTKLFYVHFSPEIFQKKLSSEWLKVLWRLFWWAHDVPFCGLIFTSRGLKVTESCNGSNGYSKGGEESISTEVSQRHRNMQVLPLLQFATTVCMLRRSYKLGVVKKTSHHRR